MNEASRQASVHPLRRVTDAATRWCAYAASVAIVLIMLATVVDVAMRTFQHRSLQGALEAGELLLVLAVYLGIPFAEQQNTNVSTDLVVSRMPPRARLLVWRGGRLVAAVFVAWVGWLALRRGLQAKLIGEARYGLVPIPVWPARLVLAFGFFGLCAQILLRVVDGLPSAGPEDTPTDLQGVV